MPDFSTDAVIKSAGDYASPSDIFRGAKEAPASNILPVPRTDSLLAAGMPTSATNEVAHAFGRVSPATPAHWPPSFARLFHAAEARLASGERGNSPQGPVPENFFGRIAEWESVRNGFNTLSQIADLQRPRQALDLLAGWPYEYIVGLFREVMNGSISQLDMMHIFLEIIYYGYKWLMSFERPPSYDGRWRRVVASPSDIKAFLNTFTPKNDGDLIFTTSKKGTMFDDYFGARYVGRTFCISLAALETAQAFVARFSAGLKMETTGFFSGPKDVESGHVEVSSFTPLPTINSDHSLFRSNDSNYSALSAVDVDPHFVFRHFLQQWGYLPENEDTDETATYDFHSHPTPDGDRPAFDDYYPELSFLFAPDSHGKGSFIIYHYPSKIAVETADRIPQAREMYHRRLQSPEELAKAGYFILLIPPDEEGGRWEIIQESE